MYALVRFGSEEFIISGNSCEEIQTKISEYLYNKKSIQNCV